ncbi:Uncharacterized protein HZ326_17470 [Fusarium oxysporum f. sp. albedinis]|nr:Uncharacterized protein HZ326_17470 [Fusarium oxysporum f. sp. albedinis]
MIHHLGNNRSLLGKRGEESFSLRHACVGANKCRRQIQITYLTTAVSQDLPMLGLQKVLLRCIEAPFHALRLESLVRRIAYLSAAVHYL